MFPKDVFDVLLVKFGNMDAVLGSEDVNNAAGVFPNNVVVSLEVFTVPNNKEGALGGNLFSFCWVVLNIFAKISFFFVFVPKRDGAESFEDPKSIGVLV